MYTALPKGMSDLHELVEQFDRMETISWDLREPGETPEEDDVFLAEMASLGV